MVGKLYFDTTDTTILNSDSINCRTLLFKKQWANYSK